MHVYPTPPPPRPPLEPKIASMWPPQWTHQLCNVGASCCVPRFSRPPCCGKQRTTRAADGRQWRNLSQRGRHNPSQGHPTGRGRTFLFAMTAACVRATPVTFSSVTPECRAAWFFCLCEPRRDVQFGLASCFCAAAQLSKKKQYFGVRRQND